MKISRRRTLLQRKLERQGLKCVVGSKELEDHILDHCVRIA